MTPDRRLEVAPHVAALIGAGVIKAVPIDADECPWCEGGRNIQPAVCDCSGSGLVAPQPGQWTLTTNDEPLTWEQGYSLGGKDWWVVGKSRATVDDDGPSEMAFIVEFGIQRVLLSAPGQEVGPVTVTAVVPIVGRYGFPMEEIRPLLCRYDDSILTLYRQDEALDLSDHLLPGLDWTRPCAALIGNPT